MSITFDQFKGHLATLHQMEIASPAMYTQEGDQTMYNIPKQVADGVFAYSYDALCTEVLRFNADGSVDEWTEAAYDDHEHYEPHFTHPDIATWMAEQIVNVTPPEAR